MRPFLLILAKLNENQISYGIGRRVIMPDLSGSNLHYVGSSFKESRSAESQPSVDRQKSPSWLPLSKISPMKSTRIWMWYF